MVADIGVSRFDAGQVTGQTETQTTHLLEMIGTSWMTQAISVAAELHLADLLADGRQEIDALASAAQCEPTSLHRLLRALTSLDLFTEHDDGSFSLTPAGTLLCTDAPQSLRSWAIWCGQYHWPLWGNLLACVKSGVSARELVTGTQAYAHIENNPHSALIFNQAMVEITRLIAGELAKVIDFSPARHAVDIGGGHGVLLAKILAAQPHLRGTLFDLPHAVAGASAMMSNADVAMRCEIATGSFFDAVPAGADVYLLKSILHNWNDEKCLAILCNCRRAMSADASLILVERIMPARLCASSVDRAIARSDLNMLVGLAGRERTAAEFTALLAVSGFKVMRIRPVTLDYSAIVAVPDLQVPIP